MESKRPGVAISVIVKKDEKILLLKRKNTYGDGMWCSPGGKLEFGESFEECAKRETLEESGVEINNIKILTAINDLHENKKDHFVTVFVISNWISGKAEIPKGEKFSEIGWFNWDNLPQPLFFAVQKLVESGYNPCQK